jgi:aminoglycoside phosphotransferase (APT) family kinase protein
VPTDLAASLGDLLGGSVRDLRRLSGGASRETWAFGLERPDGRKERLILRRDPPGAPGKGMALEARLLRVAADAGVPVPAVLAASDDPAHMGSAFVVMAQVDGETIPRKILRDEAFEPARRMLAAQCGATLARLHAIDASAVEGLEAQDPLAYFRQMLDELGQPHPAFELAFRWLAANRPPPTAPVVVHGDFRLGNLIVGPDGLVAVLDWELAHRGDPMEDLGWLCVRAWRFGSALPVAGVGAYQDLMSAYGEASGRPVDPAVLHWWETLGTLKWGVMCILQASAHLTGAVRSVELAAIGRRACENEWDVLLCLDRASEMARHG